MLQKKAQKSNQWTECSQINAHKFTIHGTE